MTKTTSKRATKHDETNSWPPLQIAQHRYNFLGIDGNQIPSINEFVYPMTNDNSEMTSLTIIQYLPWYIFYWSSGISLSWKGYRSSITEYKAYSVQNENVLKDIVTSYHSRPTAVHNEHPRTQTHCLDITGQNNWVRTVICKTIFSRWSCSCQAMGWAPHDKDTLPQ